MAMPQIIVTISRQLGSGGAYIGQQVARRLGIKYLDREILRLASQTLRENEAVVAEREERVSSFLDNFFRTVSLGSPETGYLPPPLRPIYDKDIFTVESDIIRKIAAKESAVIVGRGGFHIMKGYPGLVKVFFHASREFRLNRLKEIYHVADAGEARALLEESDENRGKFIETITGTNWRDALNYHLCLDSEAAGFPQAEEMIVKLAERKSAMECASSTGGRHHERTSPLYPLVR
jgi:cytidylate kinase